MSDISSKDVQSSSARFTGPAPHFSPVSNQENPSIKYDDSISPISSSSSPLSSPPLSDDLRDSPSAETTASKAISLKRKSDEQGSLDYKPPTTRAAANRGPPNKKRKVHFPNEVTESSTEPSSSSATPQAADLSDVEKPSKRTQNSKLIGGEGPPRKKSRLEPELAAERSGSGNPEYPKTARETNPNGPRPSTSASLVSNASSKRGRGNGRRGRGRGGRGRGGARPGGNGKPPAELPKKRILSEAEKEMLSTLKARQATLKKFFLEVGAQQKQALDHLASRDLDRLRKKGKAYEKVPEYQETLSMLAGRRREAENWAREKYRRELAQAELLLEAQKEIIDRRCRTRCAHAKSEHHAGAQADYKNATDTLQAMMDTNRAEPASPDPTQLPRLYPSSTEFGMIRGYFSRRIFEESYIRGDRSGLDDSVRRNIFNNGDASLALEGDLTTPNDRLSSPPPARKPDGKSRAFDIHALAAEGSRRLRELSVTPPPPPTTTHAEEPASDESISLPPPPTTPPSRVNPGPGSWPLSRLADAAESEHARMGYALPKSSHQPPAIRAGIAYPSGLAIPPHHEHVQFSVQDQGHDQPSHPLNFPPPIGYPQPMQNMATTMMMGVDQRPQRSTSSLPNVPPPIRPMPLPPPPPPPHPHYNSFQHDVQQQQETPVFDHHNRHQQHQQQHEPPPFQHEMPPPQPPHPTTHYHPRQRKQQRKQHRHRQTAPAPPSPPPNSWIPPPPPPPPPKGGQRVLLPKGYVGGAGAGIGSEMRLKG